MEIQEENRENCAQRTCMQRRRKRDIVSQGKIQNCIMHVYTLNVSIYVQYLSYIHLAFYQLSILTFQ